LNGRLICNGAPPEVDCNRGDGKTLTDIPDPARALELRVYVDSDSAPDITTISDLLPHVGIKYKIADMKASIPGMSSCGGLSS
jgi:hypothetical protein